MPVTADVDLYACLGCRRSAYQLDLRRAFRAVSLRYHPRRGGGESRARFEAACNAWEVLGNEDVKDLYDRYGLSGLSWDRPYTFAPPELTFERFFAAFGGADVARRFLNEQKPAPSVEDIQTITTQLDEHMPMLRQKPRAAEGLPLRPEAKPANRADDTLSLHPFSAILKDGWHHPADSTNPSGPFGSPPPAGGSAEAETTAKEAFLQQHRRKAGPAGAAAVWRAPAAVGGGGAAAFCSFGMPAKEAALADFRRASGSLGGSVSGSDGFSSSCGRKPSLRDLRMQQVDEACFHGTSLKSSWLSSFRQKKKSFTREA
ncbi:Chaperone protein DnaJ [Diplonema papillatum]|nr:Chaperone protein DnaJ [Diplonema papillatum]